MACNQWTFGMSILTDIATYIYTGLDLTPGTDFFLHNLPDGVDEGVVLQSISPLDGFYGLSLTRLSVFLFYPSWATMQNNIDILTDILHYSYGTLDGTWALRGDISTDNYGIDDLGRYISAVSFTAVFTKAQTLTDDEIAQIKATTKTLLEEE
jgi:hypothetical protein